MTSIAERVAAGVAFLDEHEPGWDLRIDLDRLNLGTSCNCILGQLHGSFSKGLKAIGVPDVWAPEFNADIACGFMWGSEGDKNVRREVRELTVEWKRLIAGRRPDAWSRTITATFDHSGNRARNIGAP